MGPLYLRNLSHRISFMSDDSRVHGQVICVSVCTCFTMDFISDGFMYR